VERVAEAVDDLLQSGVTWTRMDGKTQSLELGDILVVAPYNAQVAALQDKLERPRAEVVIERVESDPGGCRGGS
jgi:superfamily I DNA and/or RNA helicase